MPRKILSNKELESYLNRLMEEKDLNKVDVAVKEQIKEDLAERVENKIYASIISRLPEERLADFEKLLDGGASETEIQEFLKNQIGDLPNFIASALLDFRKIYLGL